MIDAFTVTSLCLEICVFFPRSPWALGTCQPGLAGITVFHLWVHSRGAHSAPHISTVKARTVKYMDPRTPALLWNLRVKIPDWVLDAFFPSTECYVNAPL